MPNPAPEVADDPAWKPSRPVVAQIPAATPTPEVRLDPPVEGPFGPPRPIVSPRVVAPPRAETPVGTVLAHGGGPVGREAIRRFVELCGDPSELVLIPTAGVRKDGQPETVKARARWRRRGIDRVTILHTHDRKRSNEEAFWRPLETATCVWIGGGAQGRLESAYVDTVVQEQLMEVLARGGVVGGYSAGAAIMSRVMIRRGNPKPIEGVGLGLIPDVIIDQHFIAANRKGRLLEMLARHPDLVGYGIDEGTVLEVHGSVMRVLGTSVVHRCTDAQGCEIYPAGPIPGPRGR